MEENFYHLIKYKLLQEEAESPWVVLIAFWAKLTFLLKQQILFPVEFMD